MAMLAYLSWPFYRGRSPMPTSALPQVDALAAPDVTEIAVDLEAHSFRSYQVPPPYDYVCAR